MNPLTEYFVKKLAGFPSIEYPEFGRYEDALRVFDVYLQQRPSAFPWSAMPKTQILAHCRMVAEFESLADCGEGLYPVTIGVFVEGVHRECGISDFGSGEDNRGRR